MTKARFVTSTAMSALLLAAYAAPSAQANLILNPSFEAVEPGSEGNGNAQFWDQIDIDGDGPIEPSLRVLDSNASQDRATDGTWFMYAIGNQSLRSFQQGFATDLGAAYTVSFDWGDWGAGGTDVGLDVFILDGEESIIAAHSYNTTANNTSYPGVTFDFVATGSSAILRFVGTGDPTNQIVSVDNVSVTLVPEPASFALLTAAGCFLTRRRRA